MPVSKYRISLGTRGSGGSPGTAVIWLWESDSEVLCVPVRVKGTYITVMGCSVKINSGS